MKKGDVVVASSSSAGGFKVDATRLPIVIEHKPSRVMGLFMLVFGLCFAGLPLAGLVLAVTRSKLEAGVLLLLPFLAAGAAIVVFGLSIFTKRGRTTITEDEVHHFEKGAFGKKEWRESLAEYRGVLFETERRSGGNRGASYTVHLIRLEHEDPSRSVLLAESRRETGMRQTWESICRSLDLPALQRDGAKLLVRSPEDLDKPVADLVAEGKIDTGAGARAPIPSTLRVRRHARGFELLIVPRPSSFVPIFLGTAMGGGFYYVYRTVENVPPIFGYFGLGFAVLFGLGLISMAFNRSRILLTREGVELGKQTPIGVSSPKRIRTGEIESVTVAQDSMRCLQIATDKQRHNVGRETDKATLEWLRDRILSHLSDPNSV